MALCLLGNVTNNPSSCCSLCNCGFFGSCCSFSVSEMIRLEVLCDAPPSLPLYRRCKCQCVQEPAIQIPGVYYSPPIHQFVKQPESCFMARGGGWDSRSRPGVSVHQNIQIDKLEPTGLSLAEEANWLFLKQLICNFPES